MHIDVLVPKTAASFAHLDSTPIRQAVLSALQDPSALDLDSLCVQPVLQGRSTQY